MHPRVAPIGATPLHFVPRGGCMINSLPPKLSGNLLLERSLNISQVKPNLLWDHILEIICRKFNLGQSIPHHFQRLYKTWPQKLEIYFLFTTNHFAFLWLSYCF